jgi:hypothetical protein
VQKLIPQGAHPLLAAHWAAPAVAEAGGAGQSAGVPECELGGGLPVQVDRQATVCTAWPPWRGTCQIRMESLLLLLLPLLLLAPAALLPLTRCCR